MTEREWLSAESAQPLLGHLRGELQTVNPPIPAEGPPQRCSGWAIALFVLTVCERVQHPPPNRPTRLGLDALRRFAEGRLTSTDLITALTGIRDGMSDGEVAGEYFPFYHPAVDEPHEAVWIVRKSAVVRAWHLAWAAIERDDPGAYERCGHNWKTSGLDLPEWQAAYAQEERVQAALLRDIVGNPFRPVAAVPTWLTPTVAAVVAGIAAEQAFDRLPVLADALEDAGCGAADLLDHCRGGGPHARGCWAVKLLLRGAAPAPAP